MQSILYELSDQRSKTHTVRLEPGMAQVQLFYEEVKRFLVRGCSQNLLFVGEHDDDHSRLRSSEPFWSVLAKRYCEFVSPCFGLKRAWNILHLRVIYLSVICCVKDWRQQRFVFSTYMHQWALASNEPVAGSVVILTKITTAGTFYPTWEEPVRFEVLEMLFHSPGDITKSPRCLQFHILVFFLPLMLNTIWIWI